jgi:membrane fusion protein, multidrug efflux system
MAFRIRASHVIALAITAGIAGWMATGEITIGGQASSGADSQPIAEREADRSAEPFKVRYVTLMPQTRNEELEVRGRTQASATIPVRAETGGILKNRLVEKGDFVKEGDLVCEIDPGSRQSKVAHAKALLMQAKADYEANLALKEQGFSSNSKLRQMNAALQAATAELEEMELDLARTKVRANASGIVEDPIAEPGDVLTESATCVTLIDPDPMLFIGQISERDIATISTGMEAAVELVTGAEVTGTITYISSSADAKTRTFLVEIRIPNSDRKILDGLTAHARIKLNPVNAFRVSPSWITLADDGSVGLRTVSEDGIVDFVNIKILAQTGEGFWITGPEPGVRVISMGQEYVVRGEKVEPVVDPIVNAGLTPEARKTVEERTQ